jgi:hypothetical protein
MMVVWWRSLPPCSQCGGRGFLVHQDDFEPFYYQIECWDNGDRIVQGNTVEDVMLKWKEKP